MGIGKAATIALLALIAFVPVSPPAIGVIQTFNHRADSGTLVYPSALSTGSAVIIVSIINASSQTLSIDDINVGITPVTLGGPSDQGSLRAYAMCWDVESGDTDFRGHTSGNASAVIVGAEVTGFDCDLANLQDYETDYDASGTTHTFNTLSVTSGDLVLSVIHANSAATYTDCDSSSIGPCIPPASVGTPAAIGSISLGQIFIAPSTTATQATGFVSSASEETWSVAVAVNASGGGGGGDTRRGKGLLVGIGK